LIYVEVAVNLPPVRGTFDYHLPPELRQAIQPGHLVTAPFGRRKVQGVVIRSKPKPSVPETRPVDELVDPHPVMSTQQIELAEWMSTYYHAPFIETLNLMIPPGLSQQADSLYHLLDENAEGESDLQSQIISLLKRRGDLRGRQLRRALSRRRWQPAVEALVRKEVVHRTSVLDAPQVRPKTVRTARLAVSPAEARSYYDELGRPGADTVKRRQAILETLIAKSTPLEVTWLYAEHDAKSYDLDLLEERGLISIGEREVIRDPIESIEYVPAEAPNLTPDQAKVWREIELALQKKDQARSHEFLLHGVTGSGKTEIYLRAVEETLARDRTAIVLVPEIALTPQTIRRFLARFPDEIGLSHSQLSDGERYDTWRRCREGDIKVMVGPRSALFMPLPSIGLIVLDESHDESYKEQARAPRYHARDVARRYAKQLDAVCILGSATPDITTYHDAQHGRIEKLTLPQRILGHRKRLSKQAERLGLKTHYRSAGGDAEYIDLPPVRTIDMRQELKAGNRSIFSRALQQALIDTLDQGQQAILFLNRRGATTYVFCRDCGWVARCPRCETSLAHHEDQDQLICHHCGYSMDPLSTCPQCGGQRVKHFGAGTQRVQSEVEALLPGVRTLRWDWDVTRTKGAHSAILNNFAKHQADVLVGTQMLAKGLDLPLVTLVGVVSADTGLNLPDFRAAERTFQVLTQVAGRAGRGLLGGRVILQTYQPDHYAIQSASRHDYESFSRLELKNRADLGYPPYKKLVRLVYRDVNSTRAERETRRMAGLIASIVKDKQRRIDLIGPAPCFFSRIRGHYRWQILLRGEDPATVIPMETGRGWSVDVDPVSLL
jgi:primosomal protein N' (replication factor Y)